MQKDLDYNRKIKRLGFIIAAIVWTIALIFSLTNKKADKVEDKPVAKQEDVKQEIFFVEATAYTASEEECDDTPNITATNMDLRTKPVDQWKIVAVSRGLEKKFPMHSPMFIITDSVILGEYQVEDRMSHKIKGMAIDILMSTKEEALEFGNQEVVVGRI